MHTPQAVAALLLLGALPVCVWAAVVDLSRLKIPNRAVLALAAVFAVLGAAAAVAGWWGWGDYLWRWPNLVVLLLLGMLLNAASLIGAGDAKLAAAAAPFVAAADWPVMLWLFPLMLLLCWLLHRLARATVGPRLAAGWLSWSSGKKFPMGVTIAATLLVYLGRAALG